MYKSYAAVVWQTGRLCGWPMYPGIYFQPEQFGYLINQSVNQAIRHCGIVCL